ncbi:right-handed parallel beta-helix repeat-containing protein [Streptomyces sp. NPDC046831]|uniref:right-handed parallel beta-helix repeat-containing protein n=1 Tax=Streptomyces sp. NPDC046831 TaxID=3154805 RepID=UPI0033FDDCA6
MTKRHIALLACTVALVGAGLGAAPPASAPQISVPKTHLVLRGQSIQQAVNAARPGDTVLLMPGTYHESVTVATSGVTLRGFGRYTVVEPAGKASGRCAEGGNGICVTGTKGRPVEGVTVANLTVRGFSRSGVLAVSADRLTVRRVTAEKNGQWGIAEERSVRSVYRDNTARNNGDAGLFLANTVTTEAGAADAGGTLLEGNRLEGNRIGVTVRRLRDVVVADNDVTSNCAGVFVVGDENRPKAGAVTVTDNRVTRNNKYCPKTARLPYLQGSGIVLTGVEDTLVTHNTVTGNTGASPLSGGVVLFKSFVGVTSERNRVTENLLDGNTPADLVDQETVRNNTFARNTCRVSRPAGLC